MARIAICGFQHETNTFAPSRADYAQFEAGGGWPGAKYGEPIFARSKAPTFRRRARCRRCAPPAIRSSERRGRRPALRRRSPPDAFERILGELVSQLKKQLPVDGVYLDLHGAMVTDEHDDGEGEILRRVRALVGPRVPLVASLDLHGNVTRKMLANVDAMVGYRTYPHVDMADTGARARGCSTAIVRTGSGRRNPSRRSTFLTGLPSQSSFIEPCKGLYALLETLERSSGAMLTSCRISDGRFR
jgi:microcystin degradation protein MlrC